VSPTIEFLSFSFSSFFVREKFTNEAFLAPVFSALSRNVREGVFYGKKHSGS